jgi:hypothetical protein
MLIRATLAATAAVAGAAGSASAQLDAVPTPVRSYVSTLTPRMVSLGPALLGHWPDPLSDALRNPAILAERRQVALVSDGFVGSWAVHAVGGDRALGWTASVGAGPSARQDFGDDLNSIFAPSVRDTAIFALVPPDAIASSETAAQVRLGLSTRAGAARVGGAFSYAKQLTRTLRAPQPTQPSSELSGSGWGLTLGWAGGSGERKADVAAGYADGTTREEVLAPGFFGSRFPRSEQREGWARLSLGLGLGTSLVALGRRRLVDVDDSIGGFGAPVLQDTSFRQTDLVVSVARRWTGAGWSAAAVVGGQLAKATGQRVQVVFFGSPQPDTVVLDREETVVGPLLVAAGEAHLVSGISVRGSVLSRLGRHSTVTESLAGLMFGEPPQVARAKGRSWRAQSELRLGLGYARPGSPFTADVFLPNLSEPRRWMAGGAFRF